MINFNPEVWEISLLEITIRLVFAVVLGGLIGLEREWSNRSAGFRTHILVCIGSASIMLLSIYGFGEFVYEMNVRTDPARLAAQVISGIGFLGAGTIIRNGNSVTGLTTAASLWVVAAIGLCAGAGFYYVATLATALVLVSLFLLNRWEKQFLQKAKKNEIVLELLDRPNNFGHIIARFRDQGFPVQSIVMDSEEKQDINGQQERVLRIKFNLKVRKVDKLMMLIEQISKLEEVIAVESSELTVRKSKKDKGGFSL